MSKTKKLSRFRSLGSGSGDTSDAKDDRPKQLQGLPTNPQRRSRPLLIIALLLLVAWLAFMSYVAMTR